MEVHHHSQSERKKWTHYFWEFLMLFLAVTLGFFVENQREHFVEHQREKQFMRTLIEDIHEDISYFKNAAAGFTSITQHIDSLIPLLQNYNNIDNNARQIYQHAVWLHYYYKIGYADRTIEQLKNSGNFRLIRNKTVSRKLLDYDRMMRNHIENMQDNYVYQNKEKMLDLSNNIFRASVVKKWQMAGWSDQPVELPPVPYFLATEKKQIDRFSNQLDQYSLSIRWFMEGINLAKSKAEELDLLIKKEYHLK